jgi:hypothetical protein
MSDGRKHDEHKNRLDLLPVPALTAVGWVLTFGMKKYNAWNWAKGMDWSRPLAALKRHVAEFENGIDYDGESGLLHLAHAVCCGLFLLTYQILGLGKDDRHDYQQKASFHDTRGTQPMGYHAAQRPGVAAVQNPKTQTEGTKCCKDCTGSGGGQSDTPEEVRNRAFEFTCPVCAYPQYCPCEVCAPRSPVGVKPWVRVSSEIITCGGCGATASVDWWTDEEMKQWEEFEND